jgi:uncharacterized cupin superfamily protein
VIGAVHLEPRPCLIDGMNTKKPPIMNVADVELKPSPVPIPPALAQRYEGARVGQIAPMIGAQKLGYNVTMLPPGKSAFPAHNHHVNEEMFFILEGEGEVRIGDQRHRVRKGDVIACAPGGPETAHQIANTGPTEMRYLAVSTKLSPEVVDYPDSGKFGVLEVLPAGPDGAPRMFRFVGRAGDSLGYWDGEK